MPSMVRIRITTFVGVDADADASDDDVRTRRALDIRMMAMIHDVLGGMGAWLELIISL